MLLRNGEDAPPTLLRQEEEEVDAMAGVQKLTAGMKAQTAMQDQEKHEIGRTLLETEGDTKNRKNREQEEDRRRAEDEVRTQATYLDSKPVARKASILKTKGQAGADQPKRKTWRREVQYDERGIEQKTKRMEAQSRRGRQTPGQKDSQSMAGKQKHAGPGKERTRKAQLEEEEKRR